MKITSGNASLCVIDPNKIFDELLNKTPSIQVDMNYRGNNLNKSCKIARVSNYEFRICDWNVQLKSR